MWPVVLRCTVKVMNLLGVRPRDLVTTEPTGYAVAASGGLERCDVQELNRELRRELHLSRQPPGYFVPIQLVQGSSKRTPAVPGRPHLRILH